MDKHRASRGPLPSRPSGGALVAGMLAAAEHLVANRPREVTQIEQRHREPWASAAGMTVHGLEEAPLRRDPSDSSGARL